MYSAMNQFVELIYDNLSFIQILHVIFHISHRMFLPFADGEKSLSMLPMVHIAGFTIGMLNPLCQGATVVILPRFEPETFLQSLQKYKARGFILLTSWFQFKVN